VAAVPAATAPAVQAPGAARTPRDDSQTSKDCPPGSEPLHVGRRDHAAAPPIAGSVIAEPLREAKPQRADVRPSPVIEDDVMGSLRSSVPEADVLLEAPDSEDASVPAKGASPAVPIDPNKPAGPDYGELRTVIVTSLALVEKRRQKLRQSELANSDLDDAVKEKLITTPGRLKVASPATQQLYLSRGRGLMERFKRENDIHISMEDIDPRDFANWLLGLKPFLTRNTWRSYRAAALAIVQSIPSIYLDEALALLNSDLQVGDDDGAPISKRKNDENATGASLRAKRMDHQHLHQLKRRLLVSTRSQVQGWLRDWLEAGINTGLRPMEWSVTALERRPDRRFPNGRVWLHVVSAKAADGRATHRTLDLSNFSTQAVEAVERMVNRSREWVMMGVWADRQADVGKLMRKLCKLMFPRMQKQYTLYSLRHQFIANMKTIYTREEVAAMVGHISLDTQVEHYGKKRSAWDSKLIIEVPMPIEEQVAQIKKRLELFDLRRDDIAQKAAAKGLNSEIELDDGEDEDAGYDPGDDLDAIDQVKANIGHDAEPSVTAADVDPSVA
jgi:hypothetical protein